MDGTLTCGDLAVSYWLCFNAHGNSRMESTRPWEKGASISALPRCLTGATVLASWISSVDKLVDDAQLHRENLGHSAGPSACVWPSRLSTCNMYYAGLLGSRSLYTCLVICARTGLKVQIYIRHFGRLRGGWKYISIYI